MAVCMVSVGFGNVVSSERIIAIVGYDSSPAKKLVQDAKSRNLLIDASKGRKTRSVVIMDDQHIILSSLLSETIANRINNKDKNINAISPEEEEELLSESVEV